MCKCIKSNFLISVPIIKASTRLVIAKAMIVIADETGLLKPNKTIAPAIGVAIPVTPILSPLNAIIQALTIPIRAFVPYKTGAYLTIKSICVKGSIKTANRFGFSPIFKMLNNVKFTNDAPVQVIAPMAIGSPVRPKILARTIELNGVILVTGIIKPKMIARAYGLLSPTEFTAPAI